VLGHKCAGGESRRELCSRWRGTARRHRRPSSPRVCVIKSPCLEKAGLWGILGCVPWRREKDRMASGEARASSMAVAPAKRPARLDGRLSSDGGSARQREAGVVQQRAHKA
jgi:hypothetical protein